MDPTGDPIVVVGAGMAGGRTFDVLRRKSRSPVVLIGEEKVPPYTRPDLSKRYLQDGDEHRVLFHPVEHYESERTEFRAGRRAIGLDPDRHRVLLDDGSDQRYSTLVVATGGAPRRLPVPGADLPGVHYLRTLDDARALRAGLVPGQRLTVVGAGLVGLEIAAVAREAGLDVVVVDVCDLPFPLLGAELGERILASHRSRGVEFRMGTSVREFRGTERVREAVLSDGSPVATDIVVVGIGIVPGTDWLSSTLELDPPTGTVTVDSFGRTSASAVYAVGDATSWTHPHFGRIHTEHEAVAQNHGMRVAGNLVGVGKPFSMVPYAWSDQYHHRLRTVGLASTATSDRQVTVGGSDGRMATLFVRGPELVGAGILDWPAFTARLTRAMQAEAPLRLTSELIDELTAD
jgi:3-phenylpropionate/trans-cinnamate dioxygenase ferredoxin reductase subunit